MGVQVRLKGISSSFKGVLRVFEKSSTGVSGKFQWRFKEVFQEVLRKIQECFKKVSRVFQDNSKEDWPVFQGSLKEIQGISGKF